MTKFVYVQKDGGTQKRRNLLFVIFDNVAKLLNKYGVKISCHCCCFFNKLNRLKVCGFVIREFHKQ